MKRCAPLAAALVLALLALAAIPAGVTAQAKDTLTVALVSHAPTLDPHMHFERVGILVNINMFDSLLHRNTKLEFEPSLATSWKPISDTQWEFKIRKGVRFHNGDVMTPADVKYSFDRVIDQTKKSPQYGNIRAIKEVKIIDAETVHIITDKPFPLLLERLVFFPIVPKKHIESVGDQAFGTTSPVGTGPWKFVEWKRDQLIRLEAFNQHWRGKPAFKHLIFRAIPEIATQVAEVKTGGVDLIRNVSADIVPELKTHPLAYISTTPILRVHYLALDMRSAPFDKKAARQAANYAVDKQTIIQKLMAGLGTQVATTVQPMSFGFDPAVKPYPYDPKKAKELLTQAGYPNGVDITLHSATIPNRPIFEAIGQMLTEVGLRTTARMWDPGPAWNKFLQTEGKATNGMYGTWGNYSVFDADAVLHPLFHSEPGGWI
ncbi:MAG TPA: ABC transporter substrate-binding protein, partial [Candidatus Deferrimicrobiaceae bacterium]|nr:ABC transporter substrate-binding protein [Candidatus Deferrimicrobiaceae bacterium]